MKKVFKQGVVVIAALTALGAQAAPVFHDGFEAADGFEIDIPTTAPLPNTSHAGATAWGFVSGASTYYDNAAAGGGLAVTPFGDQAAFIKAGDAISASFNTVVNSIYSVTFFSTSALGNLTGDTGHCCGSYGTVLTSLAAVSPGVSGWTQYGFTFQATSSASHIFLGSISGASVDLVNVTAVPEPETYAMMLAGLGAIGFMARRRKAA